MNVEIFSLYWDNAEYLVESHKKVMGHFDIPMNYHHVNGLRHGDWMDSIMKTVDADVIGFIEPDLVPLSRGIVDYAVSYAYRNKSMVGCAQVANHIHPANHIYAAPCFYFINKEAWKSIGSPSFLETYRSDVGEEISWKFEEFKKPYKALYPTHFEKPSSEGYWKLSNYGYYGIGTIFANLIYHLYQGRYQQNAELFAKRCSEIVAGKFSINGFLSSLDDFSGK